MKLIKTFLKEFVHGGHLTAFGASGIVLTVVMALSLELNFVVLIIPYLLSQIVYTYNYFKEVSIDRDSNPERAKYVQKRFSWVKNSLIIYSSLLLLLLLFTTLPTALIVLSILSGGIMYTEYFKSKTTYLFTGFKNVYISLFWTMLVFLVPFYYEVSIPISLFTLAIFLFLRGIVNSTFFDIKDIESDKKNSVKTIPILLGKQRTICFLQILNIFSAIPLVIGVTWLNLPKESLFLALSIVYSLSYLSTSSSMDDRQVRNISYLIVDAECIFWPIMIYLGKLII